MNFFQFTEFEKYIQPNRRPQILRGQHRHFLVLKHALLQNTQILQKSMFRYWF